MSATLEDTVKSVVDNFIQQEVLFTALDVSNEVKKTLPQTRHKEVRDIVRGLYSEMQTTSDYSRSVIQVQLADGSQQDALLYHPLSDSWDLDEKYDVQKRMQVPASLVATSTIVATSTPAADPVSTFDWMKNMVAASVPAQPISPPTTITPQASIDPSTPSTVSPKKVWLDLFGTESLFPNK